MPHTQENSGCFEILETLGRLMVTQESFKIKKKNKADHSRQLFVSKSGNPQIIFTNNLTIGPE